MRTLLAAAAVAFVGLTANAQSIQKESLTYTRLQPPTDHSADGMPYQTTVRLAYKTEIDRQEAAAEAEYQAALAAYPTQEAAAKAAYDERVAAYEKALKEWNSKSLAGKIIEKQVLENSKPLPPPPYQAPYPPQRKQLTHQATFSEAELATSYGRIEGRTEGPGGVRVEITLHGFQNEPPAVETKESSVYNSTTKATTKVIESQWAINYKHPVHVKALAPDGRVLVDEVVAGSDAFTKFQSGWVKSAHPSTYAQVHIDALQKSSVSTNMAAAKELINSRLGTTHPSRTTTIFVPESKKEDYSDMAEAFQLAREGYEKIDASFESGAAKLRSACALWNKAIAEFNPEDKKARINEKLIAELYRNTIEAEILAREFSSAEAHVAQARRLELNKKDREAIEELAALLSDTQRRF